MYQPRFRFKNSIVNTPNVQSFENLVNSSGTCSVYTPVWTVYGTDTFATQIFGSVSNMDDIIGDRPRKSDGVRGYRFHPMTKLDVTCSDGGSANWLARNNTIMCSGQAGQHQYQYRPKASTRNASALWSGLSYPMAGDRFEVVRAVAMPQDDITRLSTLAQTKVLAQRGKYGESNLYESLAEIDKSLGMLKDIFERASRIQDGIFKSAKATTRLRSLSNHAAGIYLLTRYGFNPLVQDVVGILKALDKPLGQMLRSTRASEEWSSQQTAALSDYVDAGTAVFSRVKTTTHKVKVRALSLDNVNITPLGRLGLGVKDFISVPWELASYSFVYDWFANIGDYLGAMVPDIGLSNVGGCVTVEWECVETVTYGGRPNAVNGGVSILSITPPPPFTRTIKYKSRTPGLNPGLSWQSDFKFNKLTRCLDALSLLTAKIAKVRNPNVYQPRPAKPESREVGKADQRAGVRLPFEFLN